MTLRPGEALVVALGAREPGQVSRARPPRFPERLCNGLWEYRPDFTQPLWRRGATTVEAIRQTRATGSTAEEGKTGIVVWTMRSPYVFVGGRLEVEGTGAKFALSWDGRTWHEIDRDLDGLFPPDGARSLRVLPEVPAHGRRAAPAAGNRQRPPDGPAHASRDGRRHEHVHLHRPVDRASGGCGSRTSGSSGPRAGRPTAPSEPVFPPRGGVADGTDVVFQWRPAADPDGDAIADYHFELSDRADMKWPLSMSFAKLISRTADAGQARVHACRALAC